MVDIYINGRVILSYSEYFMTMCIYQLVVVRKSSEHGRMTPHFMYILIRYILVHF